MRSWVPSEAGEKWSVRYDVWDLGGHIDTSLRDWAATLTSTVSAAAKGVLGLLRCLGVFTSELGQVRSKFLSAALHGCEASKVAQGAFEVSFCLRLCGLVQKDAFGPQWHCS